MRVGTALQSGHVQSKSKMTHVRLPFGLRGNEMLHISVVERGLPCGCLCPGCGDRLVAKKGSTAHHFAHYANTECTYSAESALHRYAKQLIADQKLFELPPLIVRVERLQYDIEFTETLPAETIAIRAAWLERRDYKDVVPDVLLETDTGILFVEVVVTSAADPAKREKLKHIGLPVVAINLANLAYDTALEEIHAAVLEDVTRRIWIHHPRMAEILARLDARADVRIRELDAIASAAKEASAREIAERFQQSEADQAAEWDEQHDRAGAELTALARKINAARLDAILRPEPSLDRLNLYASWSPVEKLAYSCWLLKRPAAHLPSWFNRVDGLPPTFREPSIVWRTGVFLRFIVKNARTFDVVDVAEWCVQRYPVHACFGDRVTEGEAKHWSVTYGQHAIYVWLAALEDHGFLSSDGWIPSRRRFSSTQQRLPRHSERRWD